MVGSPFGLPFGHGATAGSGVSLYRLELAFRFGLGQSGSLFCQDLPGGNIERSAAVEGHRRASGQPEPRHLGRQADGLLLHRGGGTSCLFHQRRVLLRGAVELLHGVADLGDASALFA